LFKATETVVTDEAELNEMNICGLLSALPSFVISIVIGLPVCPLCNKDIFDES